MLNTKTVRNGIHSALCNDITAMIGVFSPGVDHCKVSPGQDGIVFDLHACIYDLEQAEPHSCLRIAVDDRDIVILEIIKHTVEDTHVPTIEQEILAAVKLFMIKVKGVNH